MQLPEYRRAELIGPGATGAGTRFALESLSARLSVVPERAWARSEIDRAIVRSAADAGIPADALMHSLGVALGLGVRGADEVRDAAEQLGANRTLRLIGRALLALSDVA